MPHRYTEADYAPALAASDVAHLPLTIKLSERRVKTVGLKGTANGIEIIAPADLPPSELAAILNRGRTKLTNLAAKAKQQAAPTLTGKRLVTGERFTWLGHDMRLHLVETGYDCELRTDSGLWLTMPRKAAERGNARPIIDWYMRAGNAWLKQETDTLWSRLAPGKTPPTILAARMGNSRFGAYHDDHRVRVNWQTFQLPEWMLRHTFAHELAHASRPGGKPHGPEFWAAFQRLIPTARQDQTRKRKSPEVKARWKGEVATG